MAPSRAAGDATRAQILAFLRRCKSRGIPPTVREIGEAVGLRSPASVHRQLRALEVEGHVASSGEGRSRGWQLKDQPTRKKGSDRTIPVVGRIAAGAPIDSLETDEEALPLSPDAFATSGDVVALRVEGDSMSDAGILSGDFAIIRRQPEVENGEVAAVTLDGEGTLKVWRRRGSQIELEPRARGFDVIRVDQDSGEIGIFGRLVGVVGFFRGR